jgi:hypothetical protein
MLACVKDMASVPYDMRGAPLLHGKIPFRLGGLFAICCVSISVTRLTTPT